LFPIAYLVIISKVGKLKNSMSTILKGNCPICDCEINLPEETEETEIITCSECRNRLVVEKIEEGRVILKEAPKVEEDWGE
jgi:lysine biosynthesis protein LysW